MKKRILALSLALLLIFLTSLPVHATADTRTSTIIYPDGRTITITLRTIQARASNTITGQKTIESRINGVLEWSAVLTAQFEYNGQSATCTSANCAVFIVDESWHEVSNVTTRSGATATTSLVISRKLLGITVKTINETITLTCDKNGNLS